MKKECNIIGPIASNVELDKDLFTIFVDGGMHYSKGFKDFISVGDSDSYHKKHDVQLNKDKERNDLFHGLNKVPKDCYILHAKGFYGARLDHFFMNIGEIDNYIGQNKLIVHIYNEDALSISAFNKVEFIANIEGLFSIFSFEDNFVSINGACKYNTGLEYTQLIGKSSHGLSNVGYGKITINAKGPIFLFYNRDV